MILSDYVKNRCMKLLVEARKRVGLSQKEASRYVNMTLADYREVEKLEQPLSKSYLEYLCEKFEIRYDELVHYGNPWDRENFNHADSAHKLNRVYFEKLSAETLAEFMIVYERHRKEIDEAREPRRTRK